MARLTSEELQTLMKNEGVSRIWSWSKWNCFHTSPYEYFLKYILHKKEDRTDCIYTTTGGIAHDIMIRDVFEDEYTDEKRALKVYRLEGKNGKSKIPVKLDKNKRYQVFFIVKNQEGAANQFQIVAEHDKSRNIINEVGITNISPDGF